MGKERITVSIEEKLLKILDEKVEEFVYANRSHGFESLVADEIREEEEEAKKRE